MVVALRCGKESSNSEMDAVLFQLKITFGFVTIIRIWDLREAVSIKDAITCSFSEFIFRKMFSFIGLKCLFRCGVIYGAIVSS
jgi:hypothetical protein